MKLIKADNLACPIDGEPLHSNQKQFSCSNGHSFDIAKHGYINLLPVQHKRSKHPGDSKEMVVARTEFLNSGVYQPIAAKLVQLVADKIRDMPIGEVVRFNMLDAGCGEGYYLDYVVKQLIETEQGDGRTLSCIGLDISKQAITVASKRNKQVTWVVGTNRNPPVSSASVDMILCVFGFQSFEGFNLCLKPGGSILLVEAGPNHLKELREIIYSEVKVSTSKSVNGLASNYERLGFSETVCQTLTFQVELNSNQQINHLLQMTPHLFRASAEGKALAGELEKLNITIDVMFRTLVKL